MQVILFIALILALSIVIRVYNLVIVLFKAC
jgi:hypothetical protein